LLPPLGSPSGKNALILGDIGSIEAASWTLRLTGPTPVSFLSMVSVASLVGGAVINDRFRLLKSCL
jgi:hypothetical protein